jgi:ABC-type antimicrobial peptide transport system ATPase subunit
MKYTDTPRVNYTGYLMTLRIAQMSHWVCVPFRLMTQELAITTVTTQNMSFCLPFKTKMSSMTTKSPVLLYVTYCCRKGPLAGAVATDRIAAVQTRLPEASSSTLCSLTN